MKWIRMKGVVLTSVARTAPISRPRWTAHRSLACALILAVLAGCSDSGDRESRRPQSRTQEQAEKSDGQLKGTVEVKAEVQRALHLKIEPLAVASAPREIPGYGRVLDPAPLAAAASEWASARAASVASAKELERLKVLEKQNTASARALQGAEATAVRDQVLMQSIRDRIALSWGGTLARRAGLNDLIRALTLQDRVLVRVELPIGEGFDAQPRGARLTTLTEPQRTSDAEFLDLAPTTDPQLQGRGFLFLTRDNSLHLTPGAAITASIELGGNALQGVLLPGSAVLRYQARTWVYLQKDATTFARTPVSLEHPLPGGWLITQELRASDRTVTQGAQVLLSEELKPETILPD